ncbi:hypothetical protein Anas_11985 [Armadillidium nasatum]|uniref:Uncharacterized protein n=1 Tax=Armadillidium nasatum TaxID=96803 RepID=A0A5N5SPC5_9CRUS|nr:hypothetical protein Anas_11985 [Armadillidium nasatum]
MASLQNSVKRSVVCLLAVSYLFSSFSTVSAITVHPAVFKNFVGPFRVPHSAPILRSEVPFNWEENGANVLESDKRYFERD